MQMPNFTRTRFAIRDRHLVKTLATIVLLVLPVVALPSLFIMTHPDQVAAARERYAAAHQSVQSVPRASVARPGAAIVSPLAMLKDISDPRVGYTATVMSAMREMGLMIDEIDSWAAMHPGSVLRRIKFMSPQMQKDVASTAVFIRKQNSKIDPKTAWREAAALIHYSGKYGVPTALATAVAHTESTFDPNALSKKGASGVMQVMWRLHNELLRANGITGSGGANPLSDPEQAIAAGCLLLSRYLRAYGSVTNAMERYYGARSTVYRQKIDRSIAHLLTHHAEMVYR